MARDVVVDPDQTAAETKGEGLGNGLIIVTTIVLLIAFIAMQQALKKQFDAGMFGGTAQSSGS